MLDLFLAHGDSHGPPIPFHPMLVNLTAGLVPISLLCDLLGVWLKKPSLLAAGWWTLLAAAIATPFTAAAGWYWMVSLEHADHWQMAYHRWLGISFAALLIALTAWRGVLHKRDHAPRLAYAAAAIVAFAALLVQAELGGSMSFGRGIVISGEKEHGESKQHGETGQHGKQGAKEDHPGGHEKDHGGAAPVTKPAGGDKTAASPATAPSAAEMLEPLLSGRPPETRPSPRGPASKPATQPRPGGQHDHH